MNISSGTCWCNIWDKDTIANVGPDVICLRNSNMIKFMHLQTNAISYFKAETVATGLCINAFTGHNRFPLFAFSEVILRPNIYVYRYPDMAKFNTISPHMLNYTDIRFSEFDLLVCVGGFPNYPLCVYNYRTATLVLEQPTRVPTVKRSLVMSFGSLPSIVQFHKQDMTILCYEICTVEKESFLHKVAEMEVSKDCLKSCDHFICFGEDSNLYATNDFGHLMIMDVAVGMKSQWAPMYGSEMYLNLMPRNHALATHRGGFIISNNTHAFYVKKKAGAYQAEWVLEGNLQEINRFISNSNGEIYAERRPGQVDHVQVGSEGVSLQCVAPAGSPVLAFRVLPGLKDECVLVLHSDRVAMMDLAKGHTLCEVSVPGATALCNHRTLAIAAVGTIDGRLVLIQFERASVPHVLCDVDTETAAVVGMEFNDNWLVFQDQTKTLNVVQVDNRPPKMTLYFEMVQPELAQVFMHTFILADGPRLLVFINRNRSIKRPGSAGELWLYNWGKDKRLHRREFVLPKEYSFFCVQPPVGRWALIEIVAIAQNTFVFDQYALNEKDELQWIASTKSCHYSYIVGTGMTKHLVTWSLGGILVHFKQHKRARKPFMVCRFVQLAMQAEYLLRVRECFNSKYLIILMANNSLKVMRLPSLADFVRDNVALKHTEEGIPYYVEQTAYKVSPFVTLFQRQEVKEEFTKADFAKRDKVFAMIADFSAKVTALIDYDIAKTGKTKGIFKKFCFHYKWLDALTEEAHKLCALERASLERAVEDQSRIRDWIMRLVTRDAVSINYRVRSIFADANFESFSVKRKLEMTEFDKYRFYDLQDHLRLSLGSVEMEEYQPPPAQGGHGHGGPSAGPDHEDLGEEEEVAEGPVGLLDLKPFVVEGNSVYEHMMAPVFQLQDKNLVTSNQLYNYNCKIRYYLNDPLKQEFNKLFHEAQQLKQDTIESVLHTNEVLYKIYDNMNIMLRLLNMDQFDLPELTVPGLAQDEVIKRIMEVDDSEIKAINRRKPKTIDTGGKKGRLLLWSTEFWARALIVMMDGVLEKLWEEEIKKDIPEPEFMAKKQPHEYNLEEQKIFRAYEEAVRLLELDRRKYLRILHENEEKTLALKATQILKLNQRVAELMIMKLKYDFALKQSQVRLLTLEQINFGRVQLRRRINMFRKDINKLNDYITRYGYLLDFWDKAMAEVKSRMEAQQTRDRAIERQFRSNFLPQVPHATHEMTKLFKKRPKLPAKIFNSVLICMEASNKLSGKSSQRMPFPLPTDVFDFLDSLAEHDQPKQCPPQVDAKCWDTFVKLRRQKMESEMRLKGIGYQLLDSQGYLNNLNKDLSAIKDSKVFAQRNAEDSIQTYLERIRNMTLQLTLQMGQVEVSVLGNVINITNTVLMHVDDINNVNRQIQDAGNKKIKAMQRVAVFRRQVIFKEWEHKLYKANIAYLKYMLDAIEKCKVSLEFLTILRNWDKVKTDRQKYIAGAIERVIEQKIAAFRKHIERINVKIDGVKAQTLEVKRSNHAIDLKIERIKVDVTFQNTQRDTMMEEKRDREQRERMLQIKTHRQLMENVRRHYAHVLELQTILELLRLRTYPTLGPPLPQCHPPVPEHILSSVP